MQYGELITRSFSIVWRHRYLWLLAILGGADVTTGGAPGGNFGNLGNLFTGGSPSSTGGPNGSAALQDTASAVGRFLQDNAGLIVVLVLLALLVAIAWWLLSCVTTGALVRAAAEHDAGRPFDLGLAWRTGLGTFWSIVGLRLLGLVWIVLVAGTVVAVIVLAVASFASGQNTAGGLVIALGVLAAIVLVLASIPVGIAFILGTRAVVLEQRGPLSALGRGFQLFGSRLGRVLLVWLIQVGLGLAAGIALGIAFIPVVLVFTVVVVATGAAGGVGAGIVVAIPLLLLVVALGIAVAGVLSSFLSTFWTLAFRRMELDAPPPVAWRQTPYGPPRTW